MNGWWPIVLLYIVIGLLGWYLGRRSRARTPVVGTKRASVSQNNVFFAVFIALLWLSAVLMFFGHGGKLATIGRLLFMLTPAGGLLWVIFFAPSRQEMNEYRERKRTRL